MDDQLEFGGSYQFPADAGVKLEDFIDSKLAELDLMSMLDNACDSLDIKLKQQERKTREVNQIFTHCSNQMKKFKLNVEMEQGILESQGGAAGVVDDVGAAGGSDSDDDVQIVQTGYDPEVAARHQQRLQNRQQKSGIPADMQQKFVMRGGTLVRSSYQGGPRIPAAGISPMHIQPQRAHTTMNTPPVQLADLVVGARMFGRKINDIWYKGTLTEIHNKDKPRSEWRYRIKFDGKGLKVLPGRGIAFCDYPTDMLPVGSRVVALYKDEDAPANRAHYAGIVAESPSLRNSQRYLIFFDDGYAQYCTQFEIHKVYEQSRNVWDDIPSDSQEFIKSYLKQYPERPMVRLQPNQIIKTEWSGRWWTARVLVTDGSLVKMYFDADKRVEWIYRGSTRLEPLYTELANAEISKATGKGHRRHNIVNNKKPVVEYLRGTDEDYMRRRQPMLNKPKPQIVPQPAGMQRSLSADCLTKKQPMARKSTGKPQTTTVDVQVERRPPFQMSNLNRQNLTIRDMIRDRLTVDFVTQIQDSDGLGEKLQADLLARVRRPYVRHRCSPRCLGTETNPVKLRGCNPLIIPMLCFWERQISRQKNTGKRAVFYRGPCARRMRSLVETERYLKETDSQLTIDMFCYDVQLHTHSEFTPIKTFCDIKDLSYGKETVPISCVNGIDRQYPDYVEYSNQRIPAEGVHLNLDADFLVGCDCTDGCGDPKTCKCAKLTWDASNVIPGPKPETVGYEFRRLKEPIITGLYECNQRCKCSSRCGNRVAQNGLQLRLQVFKTEKRGWGLRSLDDIPAGGFICVYAGQLLTDLGANQDGQQYGDEYLAELDYIEVVEHLKDGYESDVDINIDEGIENDHSDTEEEEYNGHSDSDSTFSGEKYVSRDTAAGTPERKSSRRKSKKSESNGDVKDKEKGEKKSTKIIIKRNDDQDKPWSVKMKSPQAKTKEWVDNIPDQPSPTTIVISDEESNDATEKKPITDKSESESDKNADATQNNEDKEKEEAGATAANNEKTALNEPKPESEVKEKEEENADDKKDSDLDSIGEKRLEKPKMVSPTKVTLKLKNTFMGSKEVTLDKDKGEDKVEAKGEDKGEEKGESKGEDKGEEKDKDKAEDNGTVEDNKPQAETTPKSPTTEEPESSAKEESVKNEGDGGKPKKQIKGRVSRFSHLPDPKSREVQLKLMKEPSKEENGDENKPKEYEFNPFDFEDDERGGFRTRLFYDNEEYCYVMDAKSMGNIGRYLNHSCAPNVYVQNVFVDTHDMRFPWVAFFAAQYIRAGTELTWDYHYEVGSVPGKVLYCYCGAAECRGRLL